MKPLIFALPGSETFGRLFTLALSAEAGALHYRRFPDGESYLRFDTPLEGRTVVLVETLNVPDEKTLALFFAARTARELGATTVGLVAPYLAYMRQDKCFQTGEAVTSVHYAALLSQAFDWLVCVDPHLHRYSSLADIYSIPTRAVNAAPLLAAWVKEKISHPLIVGPDVESEQWAAALATDAGAPHVVLKKIRHGDHEVTLSLPDMEKWQGCTPVLVDDIISSGRTMIAAAGKLRQAGFPSPYCLGIHGLFAEDAYSMLQGAGVAGIVTTNTVPHVSNTIDVSTLMAGAANTLISAFL